MQKHIKNIVQIQITRWKLWLFFLLCCDDIINAPSHPLLIISVMYLEGNRSLSVAAGYESVCVCVFWKRWNAFESSSSHILHLHIFRILTLYISCFFWDIRSIFNWNSCWTIIMSHTNLYFRIVFFPSLCKVDGFAKKGLGIVSQHSIFIFNYHTVKCA